MAGAFVGGIALIIGIAIDGIIISTLGGFLFVTNSISAYYLKKFSVFNSIDEVIRALAETVKGLYEQVVGLHNQIGAIGPARLKLEDERKKMEARLQESNATIDKLQKVQKDFEKVNSKLANITEVYTPLKEAVDMFIKKVSELESQAFDFTKLSSAVKELAQERTRLEASVKKIGDETKGLSTQEKRIESQTSKLGTLIDSWNVSFIQLTKQIEKLQNEIGDLKTQLTSFATQNNKADDLVKRLEDLRNALPDNQKLRGMIEEIKRNN